jgi:methanogenic corrinoid protein MtbC1
MLEGKGLEVHDIGVDATSDKFVAAAKEFNADVVACSALLTTTMNEMKSVVEALRNAGIRDKVTIMVGGAPVTDTSAEWILSRTCLPW